MDNGHIQECLDPVAIRSLNEKRPGIDHMTGGHGEQMLHRQAGQKITGLSLGWPFIWEKVKYRIIGRQSAFSHSEAHGCRSKALAHRKQEMRIFRSIG